MTDAARPPSEVHAFQPGGSHAQGELDELRQLYEAMSDPARRHEALQSMGSLAMSSRVLGAPVPTTKQKSRSPTSRKQILIVDDDSDVLVSIGGFLEAENMDVVRAASGSEALNALRRGDAVDAAITDIVMPGMSGVQFLAAARQLRPHLPALVITGYAELAGPGDLPGDVAVLQKPFRRAQFVAKVRSLLDESVVHVPRR